MPPHSHGRWPEDPSADPFHEQHMEHFDRALKNALDNWPSEDATGVTVTFTADVSKNPGGIKQYHVQIGR